MYMDLLKRLNESTIVCRWVLVGVGTNLRPLERMHFSGGAGSWLVRFTMRLLLV
jgi:hypothetical protein